MTDARPDESRAFAPATASNVACGFDVFGFALEQPGDVVVARRRDEPGVTIGGIVGDGGRLPTDVDSNTAGVAVRHLLAMVDGAAEMGVELLLEKGMPLRSGLGSSAASSVAAVVAADALLGLGASREVLLEAALEGERMACGSPHADNAAPSLYGGFVLVRPREPRVVELPVPPELYCALVRPYTEVATGEARALLGDRVPLAAAVEQWGNTAALVAALFRGDYELLASALHDAVAEPVRSPLVPGFDATKAAALRAGALGCSLSGSGPTIFALAVGRALAERCAAEMAEALCEAADLDADVYVSEVGTEGARVLAPGELPCAF